MSKNLEGNLIKKAHEQVEYTKAQYDELMLCLPENNPDAHLFFITNFGYTKHPKYGKVLYKPYGYQVKLIENFHKYRFNINMLGRQMGKALAGSTPVYTDRGWSTMDDVNVGDSVVSIDGKFVKVTAVTGAQLNRKCYRVNFDNGESIIADENHDWYVKDVDTEAMVKRTTSDLLDTFYGYIIPVALPYDTETVCEDDIRLVKESINGLISRGAILNNEFYVLEASHDALMYTQSTLASIGIKSFVTDGKLAVRVRAYNDNLIEEDYHVIESIEEVESEPVYCIEVDHPLHVFLVGKTFIPTGNCVVGETQISIRNKITGEERSISMHDFHELMKKGS